MHTNGKKSVVGDCEFCGTKNVELKVQHNDLMCQDCINLENSVVTTKLGEVNNMLESSHKIDMTIKLSAEIMTSKSPALIELRASIDQDENIPADQKDYAFAKATHARFRHLQQVVFDKRADLQATENEMRLWQANVQQIAGKLRPELQEEFKSLVPSYSPKPVKQPKPAKANKVVKRFKKAELNAAAAKYGVPAYGVNSIYIKKAGISYDGAARMYAEMMGIDVENIK